MRSRTRRLIPVAILLALGLGACAVLAPFNQYSFNETARLKVEALTLVRKAEQPYAVHARKADSVMAGMNSAYRDARLRSKNAESLRLWEILLDPEQGSLAGTVRKWQWSGTLPADTIEAARKLIAQNFDQISKLENNKGK
jgi:hypothetical protein